VLDGARDADGDVELGRDDLAGLADLVVVGGVACVDRGAAGAEAQPMHHVVQPALHDRQEGLARAFRRSRRQFKVTPKLLFHHAVKPLELLLLAETHAILTQLPPAIVHARRGVAALDGALGRFASGALQVQLEPFAATHLTDGVEITSHCGYAPMSTFQKPNPLRSSRFEPSPRFV